MKRLRIIGSFVAIALLGMIVIVWNSHLPQPQYQGKPLAWWITELGLSTQDEQARRAETALREMGTNSLPYVLSELQRRDNKPADWLMRLLQQVRLLRIQYLPPSVRRHHADLALSAMAPTLGKSRLLELMAHRSRSVRKAAAHALARLPVPEGQEALIAALGGTNMQMRAAAATGLREGGYFPRAAIVPLANCIGDSDAELRFVATETFAEYCRVYAGRVPDAAISNLVQSLRNSNPEVRRFSAAALGHVRAQGDVVAAALTVAANDRDSTVRDSALSALRVIRPDSASGVPAEKSR